VAVEQHLIQVVPVVAVVVKLSSPEVLMYLVCHRSPFELVPAVPVDRVRALVQEKTMDLAEETPNCL
jgi:hypothetical protein